MLIPRVVARRSASTAEEGVELAREPEARATDGLTPDSAPAGTPTPEAASNGAHTAPGPERGPATPLWHEVRIPHSAKLMLGLCLVAFGALLRVSRNLDFFYDEWSFLDTARGWTLRSYFEPHNEHWSTVPRIIYKVLLHLNGAHSYLPFMAVVLLMHVSAAFLLFMIIRKRSGDLLALISGTILLFLGRGWEDIFWAFQIGFVGSVVFGLLAFYLLDQQPAVGRARAAAGSAALLLGLMSSGIGLFFLIAVGVYLVLDRDRRGLLWTLIVPAVAYVWWYLTFGRQATAQDHSVLSLKMLRGLVGYDPAGIGSAAAGTFSLSSLWAPIGFAGLTVAVVLVWYRKRLDCGLLIPAAVGIVLQFTLTGLVRSQYGDGQAASSRYIYIGAVFVLLILTEALRDARWRGVWRAVVPITAVAVVLSGSRVLLQQEHARAAMMSPQKYELEIAWLLRDAPDLKRSASIDGFLLPGVTASAYYALRDHYGSPLPSITVAKLARLPRSGVNNEMRQLLPLSVSGYATASAATVAPSGCRTVAPGQYADVSVPGGSTASIQALGEHAASQLVLNTWYVGNAPDGGDQRASASTGNSLRVKFPDTGLRLSWHFRVQVASGSPVALCLGDNGSGSTS